MEAVYAFSEQNSLKLYDCLVPKMYENAYATGLKCNTCKLKQEE